MWHPYPMRGTAVLIALVAACGGSSFDVSRVQDAGVDGTGLDAGGADAGEGDVDVNDAGPDVILAKFEAGTDGGSPDSGVHLVDGSTAEAAVDSGETDAIEEPTPVVVQCGAFRCPGSPGADIEFFPVSGGMSFPPVWCTTITPAPSACASGTACTVYVGGSVVAQGSCP